MTRLVDAQSAELQRALDVHRALVALVLAEQGLEAILAEAARPAAAAPRARARRRRARRRRPWPCPAPRPRSWSTRSARRSVPTPCSRPTAGRPLDRPGRVLLRPRAHRAGARARKRRAVREAERRIAGDLVEDVVASALGEPASWRGGCAWPASTRATAGDDRCCARSRTMPRASWPARRTGDAAAGRPGWPAWRRRGLRAGRGRDRRTRGPGAAPRGGRLGGRTADHVAAGVGRHARPDRRAAARVGRGVLRARGHRGRAPRRPHRHGRATSARCSSCSRCRTRAASSSSRAVGRSGPTGATGAARAPRWRPTSRPTAAGARRPRSSACTATRCATACGASSAHGPRPRLGGRDRLELWLALKASEVASRRSATPG